MNKIFYLPIKSTNLSYYFESACICPAKYLKQNRNKDIQNKYDNSLLFSKTKFTDETNCALEIVLDFNTEEVRRISENFFLFDNPLPISRVKNVFFQNEKQKKNTAFDINSGAAFIPESLLRVDNSNTFVQLSELDKVNPKVSEKDFTLIIEKFNKLLGGFALMSISGEKFQNYSLNYFDTLSLINDIIKEEIISQRFDSDGEDQRGKVSDTFDWLIMDVEKFRDLRNDVFGDVNVSTVENYSKKTGKPVIKQNGVYQLKEIDDASTVYLIAVLANYGVGKRKSIDSFISDFNSNEFPQAKREGLALIFGINNGYSAFRNKYETQNFSQDIKFKLDSQLDYCTIESIYQFVFNGIAHNGYFRYLLEWCPQLNEETEVKGFQTYQVLDKTIIHKKKEEIKKGSFQELYQKYFPASIYEKIVGEVNKYLPPYLLQGSEDKSYRYFKKVIGFDLQAFAQQIYNAVTEKEEARFKLEIEKHDENAQQERAQLNSQIQSQLEEINQLTNQVKELEESSSRLFNEVEKSKTVVDTKENDTTPDNSGVEELNTVVDEATDVEPKSDESPVNKIGAEVENEHEELSDIEEKDERNERDGYVVSGSRQLTLIDNPDQLDKVKDYEAIKNDLKSGEKGQSESPSENTDETVKYNQIKVIYQGKTIDELISKIAPKFEIEAKKSWGKKKIIDEILIVQFKKD